MTLRNLSPAQLKKLQSLAIAGFKKHMLAVHTSKESLEIYKVGFSHGLKEALNLFDTSSE